MPADWRECPEGCFLEPSYSRYLIRFQTVFCVPLVKGLFGWGRNIAMLPPVVQRIVDSEVGQDLQGSLRRTRSDPVELGVAEYLTGHDHRFFLDNLNLAFVFHHLAPSIDLFMNVYLYRADIGAATVQGRRERKFAELVDIERRHHNDPHRSHVNGAVAETSASSIHRTGIHAGGAADAFQRWPEAFHSQSCGSAVFYQDDMHLAVFARLTKCRGVLGDLFPSRTARKETNEYGQLFVCWNHLLNSNGADPKKRNIA